MKWWTDDNQTVFMGSSQFALVNPAVSGSSYLVVAQANFPSVESIIDFGVTNQYSCALYINKIR